MITTFRRLFDQRHDLRGPHSNRAKASRSRFPSVGFKVALSLVCIAYIVAFGLIKSAHLKTEQTWSTELLSQNMHSLEVIAMQKDYINDLRKIIQEQN